MYELSTPDWGIFNRQFFFTRESVDKGPEWHIFRYGAWYLHIQQDLPSYRILTHQGHEAGRLLGWAVNADGEFINSDVQLAVDIDDPGLPQIIERALYQNSGRWAYLLWTRRFKRFHVDSCGTLAAVFSRRGQVFASSASLINILEGRHKDNLADPVYVYDKTGFQYGDLTPFERIRRILPNHYLDLKTFKTIRHFFRTVPGRVGAKDRASLREAYCGAIQTAVAGFAEVFPLTCTLTGGRDTRFLLATCKEFLDRVEFITFRPANQNHRSIDLDYPAELANQFQLNHRYIAYSATDAYTQQLYQLRIGFSSRAGKAPNFYVGLRDHANPQSVLMTGFCGFPRDFFWRLFDRQRQPANPRTMVRTFFGKSQLTSRNIDAMERLMSTIHWEDPHDLLDILYIEQRVGSWSSPMMYGWAPMAALVCPFANRLAIYSRLQYPKSIIKSKTMTVDGIDYIWPALSKLPYNRYTGMRELRRQAKRRISRYRKRLMNR